MIISFLILGGFKQNIREKIFSFGGHLQVKKFTFNGSYEEEPISSNNELVRTAGNLDFIEHIQPFTRKPGLLKANEEIHGVLFKGIDKNFDFDRFEPNMAEGRMPDFSDSTNVLEVVLSTKIANKLLLKTNDDVLAYYFQDPVRVRKLKIVGLYSTGMEDFDDKIVFGDLRLLQKLNGWPKDLVGGYEIYINDFTRLDEARYILDENVLEPNLFIEKITELYMEIFDWMQLLDTNVVLLTVIIMIVASINMISILLILIMERTQMIGLLKAIGATNKQIRKIFMLNGIHLVFRGMVVGNVFGLSLAAFQHYSKLIKLDPENYYMSFVPIQWDWSISHWNLNYLGDLAIFYLKAITFKFQPVDDFLMSIKPNYNFFDQLFGHTIDTLIFLNFNIILIVTLIFLIPTHIISNINPIKSIKFD